MIKRMDKRGEGGVNAYVIGLLVLIVVAVIVILFTSNSFGFISDKIDMADLDTTLIAQKCETLASLGVSGGFCTDKIEVSDDNYITCTYAILKFGVQIESNQPPCNANSIKAICNKLKLEEGNKFQPTKTYVNEETCKEWEKK